jgi:hypothetical protein
MSEKQFNVVRASFWLIASIIWAQIIFGYATFVGCYYGIFNGIIQMGGCKDLQPSIFELLTGGMAVAMAFSGRATPGKDE